MQYAPRHGCNLICKDVPSPANIPEQDSNDGILQQRKWRNIEYLADQKQPHIENTILFVRLFLLQIFLTNLQPSCPTYIGNMSKAWLVTEPD